jgi:hypothetical protein
MTRRVGWMAATMVAVLFVTSDAVWACKCLDGMFRRCGARRCVTSCCQVRTVCCVPACAPVSCCKPVTGNAAKPAASPSDSPSSAPTEAPPLPKPPAEKDKPVVPPVDKPVAPPEGPMDKPIVAPPVEKPAEAPAAPEPKTPEAKAPEPPVVPEPKAPEPTPEPKAPDAKVPEPKAPDAKVPEPDMPAAPAEPAKPKAEKPAKVDDPFGQNRTDSLRLWTDASGQHQVEARFVSLQDGTVRLQRENGRYVRIVLDNLSVADQQFVAQQNQAIATTW